MVAHGADDGHRSQRRRRQAAQDGLDDRGRPQAGGEVQERRPADLQVVDVFGGGVLSQLASGALQGGFGLEDCQGVREVADVFGLRRAVGRRHQAQVSRDAGAARQLGGGGRPNRTVQVTVQLGLRPGRERGRAYPVAMMSFILVAASFN